MERKISIGSSHFTIRPYRHQDEDQVLALWKEAFNGDPSIPLWRWKYADGPFGSRIMVCVDDSEDRVVVMYGGVPYRTHWSGRTVEILQLMDVMSHPAYRKTGLFVKTGTALCDLFAKNEDSVLVYGFPGKFHYDIGERYLRYQELVGGVMYFSERTETLKRSQRVFGIRVGEVSSVNGEFDRLWERCRPHYPMALIRDAAFLKWRFIDHPLRDYTIFACRSRFKDKLRGYAVVGFEDNVARLVDILIPPNQKMIGEFLGRLAETLFSRGITRLETWLPKGHFLAQSLGEFGVRNEPEPLGIIPTAIFFERGPTHRFVSDNLFYTMADADLV